MRRRHFNAWPFAIALACFAFWGVVLVKCCHAEEPQPLHPFWTGPVYGVFTNAGPDSVQGPRAKIHVPIGVQLTKPIPAWGYQFIPEAAFQWTTKAYLGEDSDPLRDPTYNWMPSVRIVPEKEGALQWIKVSPDDHNSNGDDGTASRAMDMVSVEGAWAFSAHGIALDVYAKGWYVYSYGENTADITHAVNLFNDIGGRVIVRAKLSMMELATELGPEWQKYMTYVPLNEFYNFGLYGELHHGKFEGLLDYGSDVTTFSGGLAFKPN